MRRRRRRHHSEGHNVWRAYSDMMAGLLLLFVLVMCISFMEAQKNYREKLSEARALAVASYLFQDADSFLTADELTSLKEKLTSNGHSMSNPVYSDGEVNMDASRRVEVRFRLKDEEMINELKDVLAKTATAQSE